MLLKKSYNVCQISDFYLLTKATPLPLRGKRVSRATRGSLLVASQTVDVTGPGPCRVGVGWGRAVVRETKPGLLFSQTPRLPEWRRQRGRTPMLLYRAHIWAYVTTVPQCQCCQRRRMSQNYQNANGAGTRTHASQHPYLLGCRALRGEWFD